MGKDERLGLLMVIAAACLSLIVFAVITLI